MAVGSTDTLARIAALTRCSISRCLVGTEWPTVREVEAQPLRRDQGAGLLDVLAQHRPQRGVQQMGCAVVTSGSRPPLAVNVGANPLTDHQPALGDFPDMHDDLAGRSLHVLHDEASVRAGDGPAVGYLPAPLGVEGRAVEHDHRRGAGFGYDHRRAVLARRVCTVWRRHRSDPQHLGVFYLGLRA